VAKQVGNATAALAQGKPDRGAPYLQMLAHATLEPQNCLALVSARAPDVWASNQFPRGRAGAAAQAAGVEPAQVRIHSQVPLAADGRRLDADYVAQAVAT
jgi:isoquinoline 1-oxidoreductase beta subunit